jgi:ferredoxin-NADP reductase
VAPLSIWVISRIVRILINLSGRGRTIISELEQLPADCVRVKIVRPPDFNFRPGMWCRVQIPQLSSFEWHPFTISSAPEIEDYFTLHVRALGDWTKGLQELARRQAPGQEVPISLQGPFGAPAEHTWHTEHPILIAAGIGVTPFASILQSLAVQRGKMRLAKRIGAALMDTAVPEGTSDIVKQTLESQFVRMLGKSNRTSKVKKVNFIWVNREQGAFSWLSQLLLQILEEDHALSDSGELEQFIDFAFYLTGLRDDPAAMLKMMLALATDSFTHGYRHPITGIASRVTPGRPDWHRIFTRIRNERHGNVRVMYCGAKALGDTIRRTCEEFGFDFHKENF